MRQIADLILDGLVQVNADDDGVQGLPAEPAVGGVAAGMVNSGLHVTKAVGVPEVFCSQVCGSGSWRS